jgi:Lon protease-like protein
MFSADRWGDGQDPGEDQDGDGVAELEGALEHIPMFPLPNLVLLPNTFVPLHIFEPRYRKMTQDVIDGRRLMVLAFQLGEEHEFDGPPPVAPIAGVGEVVMAQRLPDGRFHIVLRGRARVRIERELPSDLPYRIVQAVEVPDELGSSHSELREAEASLRAQTIGLADALPEKGELLKQVVAGQTTPAALVDVVASTLIADPKFRQALLETPDVGNRIQQVSTEIAALSAQLVRPGSVN